MLTWAFIFLAIAVLAGIFGFTALTAGVVAMALKSAFIVFLIVCLLMFGMSMTGGNKAH
ncbi:MAG TPA: hypothetical protein VHY22_10810 [Chthoniobacteraceae bacterium]|jgi:uncharacterized membrane protein YtjA (UPF0391 family)|nr:hypothetical protein [Chthoniobacteraceae bacterium]